MFGLKSVSFWQFTVLTEPLRLKFRKMGEWFCPRKKTREQILFYDGDCGLCTRSVKFFMRVDRTALVNFAPLQGTTAQKYLPESLRDTEDLSTVVLYKGKTSTEAEVIFIRSQAVVDLLIQIGGMWRVLGQVAKVVPVSLRDAIYKFIATHRLKIFPQGPCSLPTESERKRLLP